MLGVDPNRPARAFRGTDPAALRAMLGAEAFEPMQRMRELHRQPRPLTGQEREVVGRAAAPLLRDVAAGGLAPPHIRDEAHEDRGDQAVCAWIQGPGRTGTGIWVSLSAAPLSRWPSWPSSSRTGRPARVLLEAMVVAALGVAVAQAGAPA
jgi:hypothetical protein